MSATLTTNSGLVNSELRVLFWNARSIRCKTELSKIMENLDLLVGVESWLKPGSIFSLPGFNIFRKDRFARGGGIIFAVRSGLRFEPINIQVDIDPTVEVSAIRILGFSECINFVAVYRAPSADGRNVTLAQEQWDLIANLTKNLEGISYLLGDFNAHNLQWNCDDDDVNGKRFLDSLMEANLLVLNHDGVSHFNSSNSKTSNIDLVISDAHSASLVNLNVYDELYESDHFPIEIIVSLSRYIYRKKSFRVRSSQTNWDEVIKTLECRYTEFFYLSYDNAQPSEKYNIFVDIVRNSIDKNTPKRRIVADKIHRNPVEWWDEECARLKRLRRAAFKKWRFSKILKDRVAYKRSCAVLKRTIKRKKKACYVKFTESLDLYKNPAYVWDKMRVFKNKWQKVNHGHGIVQEKSFKVMANEVIDKLTAPPSAIQTQSSCQAQPNPFFDAPFTFAELNFAIDSRNSSSGSGLDGIDYFTITRLPIKYKLILLDIYNEMYLTSDFPTDWQHAFVHLIKKQDNSGLRPITMTQCLCKILEIMMKNRLQWWCESSDVISADQSGFRKGRSCIDNVLNLSLCVQDGFRSNRDTVAVFLDIKGAFDNVVPSILLQQLVEIGCSQKFNDFVSHLCLKRFITSIINMNDPRCVTKGVPQGGVLSPLLFNIYIRNVTAGIY